MRKFSETSFGHAGRGSLARRQAEWHRERPVNEFRDLRLRLDLSQDDFAALLGVTAESCRAWDSGRRPIPSITLSLARQRVSEHLGDHELLTLQQLARELGVNIHTLRAAARTGTTTPND
jgi:DNA-binding XRE family transcriptional regulator